MRISGRVYTFLICLAIALFFWILIKLSEENKKTSRHKLSIKCPDKSKLITYQSEKNIYITYKAKVSPLSLHNLLNQNKEVLIELTDLKALKKGDKYIYSFSPDTYLRQIENSLNTRGEILFIKPDSVEIYMKDLITKQIPVKLNLTLDFYKQHELYKPVEYHPEYITVRGLQEDIMNINSIETEHKTIKKLKKNEHLRIKLLNPGKHIHTSIYPEYVNAEIHVEKFTEAKAVIQLGVFNNTKQLKVKMFPEKATVVYLVSLKDYNKITSSMFTAGINISKLENTKTNKANIELIAQPENIKNIRIIPERVEYIIW